MVQSLPDVDWPDAEAAETRGSRTTADAFLSLICSRRSVAPRRLIAPGPSPDELTTIIATGLTAPDHCLLRPWHFAEIPDERRARLGQIFAEEKRSHQTDASDDEIEKERSRAFNAPTLVAVLLDVAHDHAKVPVHEQYMSLGASVQNILLAAHAMGYGAMLTSGRKALSPMLQQAFCELPSRRLVGFISIGTPSASPKPRTAVVLERHFSRWGG